jgi:hypothetical protein
MKAPQRLLTLALFAAIALPLRAQVRPAASNVSADSFLPAVHVVGATGTFRTDVTIFNPSQEIVNVDVYFTPADADGTKDVQSFRIDPPLNPRESVTLTDIVLTYYQKSNAYGLLNVRGRKLGDDNTDRVLIVTSNTYNVAGAVAGTYGQFIQGQPIEDALGFLDGDEGDFYLPGLPNDANHRVNFVIMNPSGVELEAGVQLADAVGNLYGSPSIRTYKVPPYSMHQINDVFGGEFASTNPPSNGAPYRLNVFVNLGNGAKLLTYATVTDKRTGDPYLIPGLKQVRP